MMLLYIPNKLQKRNIYVADTSVGSQQNGLLFGKKVFFFLLFFVLTSVRCDNDQLKVQQLDCCRSVLTS